MNGVLWNANTVGSVLYFWGGKDEMETIDGKTWNMKRYNKEGTLILEIVNGKQTLNKQ